MSDQKRRKELGDYLKSRRDRLDPKDFGLPSGPRRKVRGLRREELAQLVGTGVTWYTWLEQGRDINVSTEILESLARVMRMSIEERNHLFLLAHQQIPQTKQIDIEKERVESVLKNLLDHLNDWPAYVINSKWDVLDWNRAAGIIFGEFGEMDDKQRNAIWRCFMSPSYRKVMVDWNNHAQRMLASFRGTCSRFIGEPWLNELVNELNEHSEEFRMWWPRHDVLGTPVGKKEMRHEKAGILVMEHITFQVYDNPDLKMFLYRPLNENNSAQKLKELLKSQ
jgi:transcriptional regulator with XRE-family HTH domain